MVRLLVAFGIGAAAFAQPKVDPIPAWIADLDSANFKKRDEASRQLAEAGESAVKPLAKIARAGSAEASDRAMRILGAMADGSDAKAELAARKELRKIADLDAPLAAEARVLLNRRRNNAIAVLADEDSGVAYQETRDGITRVDLSNATNLDKVLPVLKEFPEIDYVDGGSTNLTGRHAKHFADLPNLRDLNLYRSKIDDAGLKHLTSLKYLRRLPMGESLVTDEGMKTIGTMTQLEYVGVRKTKVTDAGLAHLKDLTDLTGLYLGETTVTDAGLKHLAPFTKLATLYLHDTAITDGGLDRLHGLKNLREVYLTNTKTTPAGRQRLKDAVPEVEIVVREK